MNWEKAFCLKMLKVRNALLKSPDVQLFERNYFSSKQVVFLIFPKTAGRMDIITSIEPMVLEAPRGIAGQPNQFSRQEAGQEPDAGAYDSAYESAFFHREKKILSFSRVREKLAIPIILAPSESNLARFIVYPVQK